MITDTKTYKDLSSAWTAVWRETRDHFDNESDAFKKLFSAVGEFLDAIEDDYEYDEDSIDNAPYNEDSYWRE